MVSRATASERSTSAKPCSPRQIISPRRAISICHMAILRRLMNRVFKYSATRSMRPGMSPAIRSSWICEKRPSDEGSFVRSWERSRSAVGSEQGQMTYRRHSSRDYISVVGLTHDVPRLPARRQRRRVRTPIGQRDQNARPQPRPGRSRRVQQTRSPSSPAVERSESQQRLPTPMRSR